jgi:hypothetical protein
MLRHKEALVLIALLCAVGPFAQAQDLHEKLADVARLLCRRFA